MIPLIHGIWKKDLAFAPIGEWLFDGNANDTSGNGNHGTVYNAVLTPDRQLLSNKAYSFDGNGDYIQLLNIVHNKNEISTSVWIYPTVLGDYDAVICSRGSTYYNYSITVQANGSVRFDLGNGTIYYYALTNGNLLKTNNWYHIACTWKSNDYLRVYINGVLQATSTNALTGPIQTDDWIKVGYDDYSTARYFYGKIDELRIFDKQLALNQIQSYYDEKDFLLVRPTEMYFLADGTPNGDNTIYINSNKDYTISKNESWINLADTSGSKDMLSSVSCNSNPFTARQGTVTVSSGGIGRSITIYQAGEGDPI